MKSCITIDGKTYGFGGVNSLTFKKDIRVLLNYISKPDPDFDKSSSKIAGSNYIASKLYMYYKLPLTEYDTIKKEYNNILENDTYLQDTLRTIHARFLNDKLSYEISKRIYDNRYSTYSPLMFLMILKHLLRSGRSTGELKLDIKNHLVNIFETPGTNIEIKREIADILLNSDFRAEGHHLLEILRRNDAVNTQNTNNNVVYSDSQNVHNSTINKSVVNAGESLMSTIELIELYSQKLKHETKSDEISYLRSSIMDQIKGVTELTVDEVINIIQQTDVDPETILKEKFPQHSKLINKICDRIVYDTSLFGSFSLSDIFKALWTLISIHHNKDDLMERLIDEMLEMDGMCTTGHLSRFINVFQGYVSKESLMIKMSNYDEFKGSCVFYLNKQLQDSPEAVQDSMLEDKVLFYDYVLKLVKGKIEEWKKENGIETIKMLLQILKEYTGKDFSEDFISLNII